MYGQAQHDGLHKRDNMLHFQFSPLQHVVFALWNAAVIVEIVSQQQTLFSSMEFVITGGVKAFCWAFTGSNCYLHEGHDSWFLCYGLERLLFILLSLLHPVFLCLK